MTDEQSKLQARFEADLARAAMSGNVYAHAIRVADLAVAAFRSDVRGAAYALAEGSFLDALRAYHEVRKALEEGL